MWMTKFQKFFSPFIENIFVDNKLYIFDTSIADDDLIKNIKNHTWTVDTSSYDIIENNKSIDNVKNLPYDGGLWNIIIPNDNSTIDYEDVVPETVINEWKENYIATINDMFHLSEEDLMLLNEASPKDIAETSKKLKSETPIYFECGEICRIMREHEKLYLNREYIFSFHQYLVDAIVKAFNIKLFELSDDLEDYGVEHIGIKVNAPDKTHNAFYAVNDLIKELETRYDTDTISLSTIQANFSIKSIATEVASVFEDELKSMAGNGLNIEIWGYLLDMKDTGCMTDSLITGIEKELVRGNSQTEMGE